MNYINYQKNLKIAIQILNQFRQIRKMKIHNEIRHHQTSSKQKLNKHSSSEAQNYKPSLQKKEQNQNYDKINQYDRQGNWGHLQQEQNKQIKNQNARLKRMLKQTQAKRIQITKQCSELANKYEKLEQQNMLLHRKIKDVREMEQGEKYRYEELKFLNKQLSTEIQELRKQNQTFSEKLRHHSEVVQKKYQQLEQKAYKRIEQALKRIKKAIHYLSSLSAKQIEKTKKQAFFQYSIQLQNLTKAAEILKGKYTQNLKSQQQIQQLMNPIRNIQQDLHKKNKQLLLMKEENGRLTTEVKKQKKIHKQVLPQYKQAIQKLKKNLAQVRMQLTENQYDKCQVKRRYEQKIKDIQIKYQQLLKQNRKIRLENKIYQKKLQQIEDDVEEQKQRLMDENQLLKKLYKSQNLQIQQNHLQNPIHLYQQPDHHHQSYYFRKNQTDALSNKTTVHHIRKHGDDTEKNDELWLKDSRGTKINNLKKNYSQSLLKGAEQKQQKNRKDGQDQKYGRKKQRLVINEEANKNRRKYKDQMSKSRQNEAEGKNYEHLRHNIENKKQQNKLMSHPNQQKLELSQYQNEGETSKYKGPGDIQRENDEEIDLQQEWQYGQRQISNNSMTSASQQGLKNQIYKIDQQIMQIQKTLDRELNMYK